LNSSEDGKRKRANAQGGRDLRQGHVSGQSRRRFVDELNLRNVLFYAVEYHSYSTRGCQKCTASGIQNEDRFWLLKALAWKMCTLRGYIRKDAGKPLPPMATAIAENNSDFHI
jgi:hypothetical protein